MKKTNYAQAFKAFIETYQKLETLTEIMDAHFEMPVICDGERTKDHIAVLEVVNDMLNPDSAQYQEWKQNAEYVIDYLEYMQCLLSPHQYGDSTYKKLLALNHLFLCEENKMLTPNKKIIWDNEADHKLYWDAILNDFESYESYLKKLRGE